MPIGQLFVIAAPSGAGKTSLVAALLARLPALVVSISHTTRQPRPGEVDGRDYHFVTTPQFEEQIAQSDFLEHANVFGNLYGTNREALLLQLTQGLDVILEIDWQGAAQVLKEWPDALSIFILPPSREALHARLIGRNQDHPDVIQARMAEADETLSKAPQFDYWIVNDAFEVALDELRAIVLASRQRRARVELQHERLLKMLLGEG